MASPAFDFDDQLSEDWISQPRSSEGTQSPAQGVFKNSNLHSRIPLPTKPVSKLVSSAAPSSNRPSPRPLHAKSKSELNISTLQTSDSKGNSRARRPPSASRSTSSHHRRSSSAQSWTADGTVQRRGSEIRNAVPSGQMTPEWRRRLLQGQSQETGEQKDLFSSIGLENVFRPPQEITSSAVPSPKRGSQDRPRAESSTIYPSSPPPYPYARQRRTTNKSTSPSPLRKRHEHDHSLCLAKGGKCEGALRTPTPTKRQSRLHVAREEKMRPGSDSNPNTNAKRVQSGTSFTEHESISPVTMQDGRIDYHSIQRSVLQMQRKMEALGLPEQERPSSRSSEQGIDYGTMQRRQTLIPDATITSQADDTVPQSESVARKGDFVNLRRGGYSSDDNFHRLPLSPSSFRPDFSFVDQDKSDWSAPQLVRPTTPQQAERVIQSSPGKPRSGGSPLKLFGQYDTFTNNHLMRRLSQYVDYNGDQTPATSGPPSPSPRRVSQGPPLDRSGVSESGFGAGVFDEHTFPPAESFLAEPVQDNDPSLPPVLPPTDPVKFMVPLTNPDDGKRRASRANGKRTSNPQPSQRSTRRPSLAEFRRSLGDAADVRSDGKRILYSPVKEHQVKRRRTLLSSVSSPQGSPDPPSFGLLIGKKRTDALPGERARRASPETMAGRDILRPRSVSSPSLCRSSNSAMSSWLGAAPSRQPSQRLDNNGPVDAPTKQLAEDLASFAVNVATSMAKGERKASVTTADFFKEANMIMRHLRGQPLVSESQTPVRRTPSARASGDVSLVDQMSDIEELDEESIRSLRSLQKQRSIRTNAEYIRKALASNDQNCDNAAKMLGEFREKEDFGLALTESLKNLRIHAGKADERDSHDLPESDAPHIRILERATGEGPGADGESHTHVRTRSSTDVSVNPSIRTGGSSNNSSRKFNIPPDTVKDLLSDQVGRMIFDHAKGLWVRNRVNSTADRPGSSHLNSDGTEDDPLKGIPDLPEDDTSHNHDSVIGSVAMRTSSTGTVVNNGQGDSGKTDSGAPQASSGDAEHKARPSSGHGADSSQLSRFSKFGSSQAAAETRATSWSTAPPTKVQHTAVEPELPRVQEVGETTEEQIGEQAILEPLATTGYAVVDSPGPTPRHAMRMPFSSPFSQLPDNVLFPPSANQKSGQRQRSRNSNPVPPAEQTPVRHSQIAGALKKNKENAQRHLSAVRQRYSERPVSRIDEQDEQFENELLSRHTPETSLALVTPHGMQKCSGESLAVPPPTNSRHSNVGFHRSLRLDPLSDFTMHQGDESLNLDIDYVKRRHGLSTHEEIDSRFSLAVKDLVARITDIEPFEPYWDYIRKMDLSGRKLMTLHMLEDFCERVEELNVSDNELGQINGAPAGLTLLDVSNNCLTGITAWGHLINLHYLDVSNNQINSLAGFAALPHLRELRADNNQITSIEGVGQLSALLKLSVRDNQITDVDFSQSTLPRLTELDLSGNEIGSLSGLEQLESLQQLRLAGNKIRTISSDDLPSSLTELDLAENGLTELEISLLADLKMLDVDGNSLSRIAGLDQAKTLETLSWRDQRFPQPREIAFYEATDVRNLALSGNKLNLSGLRVRFLNLNVLEMASCGLEALPSCFGRLMPNLRYLSLSHNAIKDIKPLVGIKRLQQLHLVENRIHRLRNTSAVLEKIGTELACVDLRVNPITLGFYPVPPTPSNTTRGARRDPAKMKQLAGNNSIDGKEMTMPPDALVSKHASQEQEQEQEHDNTYKARLDEGTALRRRVFELLVYHSCPVVKVINNLAVDEAAIEAKDEAWSRLVELKIVKQDQMICHEKRDALTEQPK